MEINTSHYFPLNLDNLLTILKLIDTDTFEVRAGIIVQVTPKHNTN